MISCRVRCYRLVVLLVVAASLSACSRHDADTGGTRVPRATTTSTTSVAERYAVPETITPEYVNDVLAALNRVYGDVVRTYIETRELRPDNLAPLRAIYYESEMQDQAAALARSPLRPRDQYKRTIGDRRITVDRMLSASKTCIAVEATYDFSALTDAPAPPSKGWVTLKPADPVALNPTPWQIASESNEEENGCGT